MEELFTVEREDGETISVDTEFSFSIFCNRAEAEEALHDEADNCEEPIDSFSVVRFVREPTYTPEQVAELVRAAEYYASKDLNEKGYPYTQTLLTRALAPLLEGEK